MGRIQSTPRSRRSSSGPAAGVRHPATTHSLARRGLSVFGIFALGLTSGLLVVPFLESNASPEPVVREVAAPIPVASSGFPATVETATRVEAASVADDESLLSEWLEMARAERLQAMARKVTGAGLDLVAETVIDRLEEDALKSLIASTTDFSSAELAEIEDVPAFAMGLAQIAMEGTVREASEPDDAVRPIDFSTEITWDHRAAFPQSQFDRKVERIYAVFESDALGLSQTLAKWTRVEDGEIMLFERHAIRPAADSSFVYLDAPASGWSPGEYRVDFYSADRELRWLASGQHRVTL